MHAVWCKEVNDFQLDIVKKNLRDAGFFLSEKYCHETAIYLQVYDNMNVYYILCKKNNVNAIIRNILKYKF